MTPKFAVDSRVYFVIPRQIRGAATVADWRVRRGQIEYQVRLGSREYPYSYWIAQKFVYDPQDAKRIAKACAMV